ncbi:hypothetical protein [Streptosporangium saharense]|uniref:Uncharacterized protein n=1 Tax=Streptosporangium saharense TaxID=1706840 RepID=A0A7W7QWD4_9ACTN|nr:hypothetical protein [Streptosporangium saharense]MBB4920979.1 hypothetical protein [Streptosporangium saharense]
MTTKFLVILTLSVPRSSGGSQQATLARVVPVEPGTTRADLLTWALGKLPDLRGGDILFFSAEPNTLPAWPEVQG